jgi:enterochelin esterase-like enzyme
VGLTSGALALLLALAVAAGLAGILLGWRRLGRPGARRVAARAAALAVLQVGVVALVLVLANRSLVFYSSWSDLAGHDSSGAAVRPARAGRVSAADTVQVLGESAVAVPGVPGTVGRLAAVRIHGELSGLNVQGQLYLPPAAASPAHPYPVIVAITGQPASGRSPYAAGHLAAAAAAQIAAGRLQPVIVLMLPAGPARVAPRLAGTGRAGPGCLDVPGGVQGQTFLTQDVPRLLEGSYHASAAGTWALLGDRAGGYCSLELALSDSATFAVAAVPRGHYGSPPATQAGGSPQIREQENLMWQLRHQPAQPVRVLFAGPGTSAGLGRDARFARLARPPMRVTSAGLARGAFPLAPVFDWLGAALRSPAPAAAGAAGAAAGAIGAGGAAEPGAGTGPTGVMGPAGVTGPAGGAGTAEVAEAAGRARLTTRRQLPG